ncbi:MAG: hypothetical protein AAFY78_22290 [Cyanobacteria bacterium J06648_16]
MKALPIGSFAMTHCLRRWVGGWGLPVLSLGIALPVKAQPAATPSPYLEDLIYFEGSWSCQINEVTYDWTVERTLEDFWFEGYAVSTIEDTEGEALTTELMGHDAATGAIFRFILTAEGNYLGLESNGWRDGELVWEGDMVRPDRVLPLEGTVTKVNDDQFTSTFLAQLNGTDWVPVQTEMCDRIPESTPSPSTP